MRIEVFSGYQLASVTAKKSWKAKKSWTFQGLPYSETSKYLFQNYSCNILSCHMVLVSYKNNVHNAVTKFEKETKISRTSRPSSIKFQNVRTLFVFGFQENFQVLEKISRKLSKTFGHPFLNSR